MNIWKAILSVSISTVAITGLGCDRSDQPPEQPAAQAPPAAQPAAPVAQPLVQQPSNAQPLDESAYAEPQSVVVDDAPPAVIVENQPPAPSPDFVWIGGFWNWDNHHYRWEPGRYERRPRPGAAWVAPRYERDAHGFHFTAGHWRR